MPRNETQANECTYSVVMYCTVHRKIYKSVAPECFGFHISVILPDICNIT